MDTRNHVLQDLDVYVPFGGPTYAHHMWAVAAQGPESISEIPTLPACDNRDDS